MKQGLGELDAKTSEEVLTVMRNSGILQLLTRSHNRQQLLEFSILAV